MKKIRSYIIAVLSLALLIFIDQITKHLSYVYLADRKEPYTLIKNVLNLPYLQNDGAAWGMLSGRQWFFIILTVLMVVVIAYVYIKTPRNSKYFPLRATLIALEAGAIGNLIDRVIFRYVRDFIELAFIDFPVFNFADICVSVSMVVLIILIFFVYRGKNDFAFLRFSGKGTNHDNEQ